MIRSREFLFFPISIVRKGGTCGIGRKVGWEHLTSRKKCFSGECAGGHGTYYRKFKPYFLFPLKKNHFLYSAGM